MTAYHSVFQKHTSYNIFINVNDHFTIVTLPNMCKAVHSRRYFCICYVIILQTDIACRLQFSSSWSTTKNMIMFFSKEMPTSKLNYQGKQGALAVIKPCNLTPRHGSLCKAETALQSNVMFVDQGTQTEPKIPGARLAETSCGATYNNESQGSVIHLVFRESRQKHVKDHCLVGKYCLQ